MVCGCYDENSVDFVKKLVGETITQIDIQDSVLKIDPVFVFSNGLRLEIFSTDTFEPWTFNVEKLGLFVPTPSEPQISK